jgi:hypothetical protein
MTHPRRRPSRLGRLFVIAIVLVAVAGVVGTAAVYFDVAGMRGRASRLAHRIEWAFNPTPAPPDRPIEADVVVTPKPSVEPTATPTLAPGQTAAPTPAPTPTPQRVAVDVNLVTDDPATHFITEIDHEWCAVAATQMVLALHGKAPLTEGFQRQLAGRIDEWESSRDSRNGGWGPTAMTLALAAYGVPGYEVRTYETRQDAMSDAARAIETTHAPVILLTWRGAHSWVMTGFRADADPLLFDDARMSGTYILDPWYPRVSSIWGASDKPGTFEDLSRMRDNYLPWRRPEGSYPGRDGMFLAVVPTQAATP